MADWRSHVTIAAQHITGDTGGNNSSFAQSFVPNCDRIEAIEVCAYPVSGTGWIRFDIHEDDNNKPSHEVLCRTWVQVDHHCPIPHGGFITLDVPDILVTATQKYWFTFVEYASKDSPSQSLTNLGSSRGNQYPDGQLFRPDSFQPSDDEDATFRIIAKCPSVPGLREITAREQATVPSPIWANGDWREMLPNQTREERGSTWSAKVLGLIGRLVIRQLPYNGRLCLALELYNDSGGTRSVSLWNPKNVEIQLCTQDGKTVPPEEITFRAIHTSVRQVSLPSRCWAGSSFDDSGDIHMSDGHAIVRWDNQRWTLSPGVYELRSEYSSLAGLPPPATGGDLWDGRLTLPPLRIVVKDDGTLQPFAYPDKE